MCNLFAITKFVDINILTIDINTSTRTNVWQTKQNEKIPYLGSWCKSKSGFGKVGEAAKAGCTEAGITKDLTEQFLGVDGAVEAFKPTCQLTGALRSSLKHGVTASMQRDTGPSDW